jgi:hypothetical protein
MRFWWTVAVVLVGISVNGLAQQNNTFKVKSSAVQKTPKTASAPIGKTGVRPATASETNARDLQTLERQTATSSVPSRSVGKKTTGTASALKPVKDKPNPPINFARTGGHKGTRSAKQDPNPYAGRLRQKGAH